MNIFSTSFRSYVFIAGEPTDLWIKKGYFLFDLILMRMLPFSFRFNITATGHAIVNSRVGIDPI